MEIRLTKEQAVCVYDALDCELTQAAEHDFILPDYCPDIFRVLKCTLLPDITSSGINGGRLTFDLGVTVRVIYRSEEGGICCVEHSETFTRSAELTGDANAPFVRITTAVQSVGCRVVDKRRIEVKGSVSCRAKVEAERSCELVSSAAGCGIQLRRQNMLYPAKRLTAAKRITVIEELELAEGKPPFGTMLRCGVSVSGGAEGGSQAGGVSTRFLQGKLVTKGEAAVQMLYLPKGGSGQPETMRFVIPFSQIIDIAGLDEGFDVTAEAEPSGCIVTPKPDSGLLECELVLTVNIRAVKYKSAELVTDAYSTRCELTCERAEGLLKAPGKNLPLNSSATAALGSPDGSVSQVYDVWCENISVFSRYGESEEDEGLVYGKLTFCMLGRLTDGTACYSEREATFEQAVHLTAEELDGAQTAAAVKGCSYTLGDDGTVRAKAEIGIVLTAKSPEGAALITSIVPDPERPKPRGGKCAVRICYSESGESLWDIAKKYSAEAEAISDENPEGSRVLIIPMKK